MKYLKINYALAFLVFFLVPNVSISSEQDDALNFVQSLGNKAIEMLASDNLTENQKIIEFEKLLDKGFEVPLIARYALGKYWRKTPKDKRERYVLAFRKFIVDSYAARLGQFGGERFYTKSVRNDGKRGFIVNSLIEIGYDVLYKVMNSKDYGIPQNRERLWIYAFYGTLPLTFHLDPPVESLKYFFKDFLDKNPEKKLFKSQKQIARLEELYQVDFRVKETACVDLYNKNIRGDGISVTILEPHHNKMRIVHPPKNNVLLVRNYSVKEHFRLMGFKDEKINFGDISYSQLCKMASNGWDINQVAKIYQQIFKQIYNDEFSHINETKSNKEESRVEI
mgnify:CR=1 FL=1